MKTIVAAVAGDRAAQAKVTAGMAGLSAAGAQLVGAAMAKSEEALMIANAARIDGLVRSVDEAVRAGRTEDATAAAAVLQKALHKQVTFFQTFHSRIVNQG